MATNLSINIYVAGIQFDINFLTETGPKVFLLTMAFINMLLMLFNLLPIGPLDGHYILPYFLSKKHAYHYTRWNAQYGGMALMGLVMLSFAGVPVFAYLSNLGRTLASYLIIF